MAESVVSPRIYVSDTSYLLELFGVPDYSEPSAIAEIKRRFSEAVSAGHEIYVPLPCLFELGNHIMDIRDGRLRREKTISLCESLQMSQDRGRPWTLSPGPSVERILPLFQDFAKNWVNSNLSLVDFFTVHEAMHQKQRRRQYQVHIWTRDQALKAREPDAESNPFL